jgi:hypothetical protein
MTTDIARFVIAVALLLALRDYAEKNAPPLAVTPPTSLPTPIGR